MAQPIQTIQRIQPIQPIERTRRFTVWTHLALLMVLALPLGCAPKQRIPLDVGPGPVMLFVDGELALGIPEELELRADRDHKVFVKRDGYTPELLILESREREGRDRLEPERIDIRLQLRRGDRDVLIEDEEEDEGGLE